MTENSVKVINVIIISTMYNIIIINMFGKKKVADKILATRAGNKLAKDLAV